MLALTILIANLLLNLYIAYRLYRHSVEPRPSLTATVADKTRVIYMDGRHEDEIRSALEEE